MLRAIRALKSVGRAIASSSALVCSDLRAAQNRAHRLIGGADHVVVGVLLLQADADGLAMGAQHLRFRGSSAPNSAMIRCHSSRAARSLAASMKKFMPMAKKKRQPPGKRIHIHARCNRGAHVFAPVRQREGQLLHQVRAGLLHVVAGDRDRVEFRHLARRYIR